MLIKILYLLVLINVIFDRTYADNFLECEGKEDSTFVEVKKDCSYYIFCHGEDSFSVACPEDSPYFSIEDQTCDINEKVCQDRPINKENSTTKKEEAVSTVTSSSTIISSTSSFTITIPTATSYYNASSTTDVAATTTSSSTNSPETPLVTTTALPWPTVPSFCPPVDNPFKAVFLPHKKSCSEYFLCYQGDRLPMRCSNMLHFDVRQQKCDYPENVKCQLMDFASPREQCLPYTFDLYPHPLNCNYYYQCSLGYLKVMQCPLNMGWHYEKRVCVRRSQAKCYNSFARVIS